MTSPWKALFRSFAVLYHLAMLVFLSQLIYQGKNPGIRVEYLLPVLTNERTNAENGIFIQTARQQHQHQQHHSTQPGQHQRQQHHRRHQHSHHHRHQQQQKQQQQQ